MGGPPTMNARPVRRGTSKAVPVVVSAGLAVGVFCGLLFGVGTGKNATASAPPSGNNVKKVTEEEAKADPGAAPKGLGATTTVAAPKPPGAGSGSGSAVAVAAAGSGAGSAAPAAAGSAAPATPAVEEKKLTKITFKLKPEAAAKDAKLTVDGKDVTNMMIELPVDQKSMKVEIQANGYRTFEKKQDISSPGEELTIEYELVKKPSSGTRPSRPRRPDRPPSSGGGLIDI